MKYATDEVGCRSGTEVSVCQIQRRRKPMSRNRFDRLDVSTDQKKEENKKRAVRMTVIFGIVALVLVLAMMVEIYL